jgi:hypothetical protein
MKTMEDTEDAEWRLGKRLKNKEIEVLTNDISNDIHNE